MALDPQGPSTLAEDQFQPMPKRDDTGVFPSVWSKEVRNAGGGGTRLPADQPHLTFWVGFHRSEGSSPLWGSSTGGWRMEMHTSPVCAGTGGRDQCPYQHEGHTVPLPCPPPLQRGWER